MTIAEVSRKFELTPDTLRYYERVGLIREIGRTSGGNRNYTEEDCRWINFVKCMRASGLPIEVLIEYMRLFSMGECTLEARKNLLLEQRELLVQRIEDMKVTLGKLDVKISRYDQQLMPVENDIKAQCICSGKKDDLGK